MWVVGQPNTSQLHLGQHHSKALCHTPERCQPLLALCHVLHVVILGGNIRPIRSILFLECLSRLPLGIGHLFVLSDNKGLQLTSRGLFSARFSSMLSHSS